MTHGFAGILMQILFKNLFYFPCEARFFYFRQEFYCSSAVLLCPFGGGAAALQHLSVFFRIILEDVWRLYGNLWLFLQLIIM